MTTSIRQPPEIRIPFSRPNIDEEECDAVVEVLRRKWLTTGVENQLLEAEFAATVGTKEAVAVANGTVSLHLALVALGVRAGDEVILPSFSFVAAANAVRYCDARPVFADIVSLDNLNAAPDRVAALVTQRTQGIVITHYGGHPADLLAFRELADRLGLFLLEDAAHAHGAGEGNLRCGSVGDAASFSFYSTKNMTCGEGGILTTNQASLAERCRRLRNHGLTTSVLERDSGRAFGYDMEELGYNYRMDEIRASLARVQLRKLTASNDARRSLVALYHDRLHGVRGLRLPFPHPLPSAVHHLMPVLLPAGVDRRVVMTRMLARGIQTSYHYHPTHLFTYYRTTPGTGPALLPVTEEVGQRVLSLPLFPTLTPLDVETVAHSLRAVLREVS